MEREHPGETLTRGKLLARNSLINFAGQILPMVVALISIPFLIHGMGTDRFGIVTLIWLVIGYFSLFDFGLSRALTQLVAEKIGVGDVEQIPSTIWTATVVLTALSILGGVALYALAWWLVYDILKIPVALQQETLAAVKLMAATIPIVLLTASFAGVLQAYQRFDIYNAIRVPYGIYNYVSPLLVLPFSNSIFYITAVLAVGRLASCIVHFIMCLQVVPSLRSKFIIRRSAILPLFRYGGWITVTNIIGPLMVYLDRFIIGAVISVTAVAYYATPYEVVTKLWIIPGALTGVVFPAFATSYIQNRSKTQRLFVRSAKYTGLALFPAIVLITSFAYWGLLLWLGRDFAEHSTSVMQILAVGVFINCLSMVFFAYVQGIGRPDLTAKLHMIELPLYLPLLWWAIHKFGILGAAIAWTVRVSLDGTLLLWLSDRFLCDDHHVFKQVGLIICVAVGAALMPVAVPWVWLSVVLFLGESCGYVYIAFRLLDDDERAQFRRAIRAKILVTKKVP